ncbi:hypothetical protein [Oricola sp.]|uniref:hypothetical protein n=1 Tax=Oricola sp. TaxID=1979950 RepID=UPI0025F1EE29|nr:hypothetical protein [Oricola sp.]MCI5075635.1 hypothetical protein [Oricola sp.]
MPKYLFTDNDDWEIGFEAMHDPGYRTLIWPDSGESNGDFGGGTLQVLTNIDGVIAAIPDSKVTAASVDGAEDQLQQLVFVSGGSVIVRLSGATNPNLQVAIK